MANNLPRASECGMSAGGILIKRNREIAETRDELVKAQQRLNAVQVKNQVLLEENSEVDSEVFAHSSRAAKSEERLAELFDSSTIHQEELAQAEAAHARSVAGLTRKISVHIEAREGAEMEIAERRRRVGGLGAELDKLRGLAKEHSGNILQAREALQDGNRTKALESNVESVVARDLERRLEGIHEERAAHDAMEAVARVRVNELEIERKEESRRVEELSMRLRETVEEQRKDTARIQQAEAVYVKKGGDASAVLAAAKAAASANGATGNEARSVRARRDGHLRAELAKTEEQNAALRATLQSTLSSYNEEVIRVQGKLDRARDDLRKNLQEAAVAQGAGASKLEEEIEVEKGYHVSEDALHRALLERMETLTEARSAAEEWRHEAVTGKACDVGRCRSLAAELDELRSETEEMESGVVVSQEAIAESEFRTQSEQAEGAVRIAKLREALDELRRALMEQAKFVKEQLAQPHRGGNDGLAFAPKNRVR
eukprot:TRINITY_DN68356_c0_g1_i1.p1 TRINITY_DN68356_c0_g1~~TRINITY_DN68356_c0_g1_i1.p1  ORF type:complete len:489 (-),score=100.99 TRINITY_DN68356_c0_g1_i1:83-1549(-)